MVHLHPLLRPAIGSGPKPRAAATLGYGIVVVVRPPSAACVPAVDTARNQHNHDNTGDDANRDLRTLTQTASTGRRRGAYVPRMSSRVAFIFKICFYNSPTPLSFVSPPLSPLVLPPPPLLPVPLVADADPLEPRNPPDVAAAVCDAPPAPVVVLSTRMGPLFAPQPRE